jgi:glyoxylase-like metal-dependent hydrolase (beta-lactamase superfamily II)
MLKKKYFRITVFLFLLLGLFFYWHGFYFAVNIKGPSIPKKDYTLDNIPFNDSIKLKLHVFNTGVNKVSSLLVGEVNPWRPVPAFVIEHPKYGLIVFDTGLSSKIAKIGNKALHPITRMLFDTRSLKDEDLPDQMQRDSLPPKKVNKVIFSHLHFDHIGNADAFTNATFYVGQDTDMEDMTRMEGFEPDFIAKLQEHRPFVKIDFSKGKPFATFKKAVDLLGDGSIIAVRGNGHLNGSISLFVRLPRGMVLLTGDEVVHFDWLKSDDVQRISKNPKRAAEVRNRVRLLEKLRPDILIFPGHDLPEISKKRTDIIIHNPKFLK